MAGHRLRRGLVNRAAALTITWIGDPYFSGVQQELGSAAYQQALAEGRALSLSQAIDYAMEV